MWSQYRVIATPIMIDGEQCQFEMLILDIYDNQLESVALEVWTDTGEAELPADWTVHGIHPTLKVHHGPEGGMLIHAVGKDFENDDSLGLFPVVGILRPPKGKNRPHCYGVGWSDGRSIDVRQVTKGE